MGWDALDAAARSLGDVSSKLMGNAQANVGGAADMGYGFNANNTPSVNGSTTRQGQVQPYRPGKSIRNCMRWFVPEQPIINMYINPKNITYDHNKSIKSQRVKAGFALQYWGEELSTLSITGTTGTSGIEGINVLHDVYRNEQLMFDPYALYLAAERDQADQASMDGMIFGENDNSVFGIIGDLAGDQIDRSISSTITKSRNKPTLASLAFGVEMYWCGEVYRGFFTGFNFIESSESLGLFEYTIKFTVTQKRGFRYNFLQWHKDPSRGQSDWGPGGPPLSYGAPAFEYATASKNSFDQPNLNSPLIGVTNPQKGFFDSFLL